MSILFGAEDVEKEEEAVEVREEEEEEEGETGVTMNPVSTEIREARDRWIRKLHRVRLFHTGTLTRQYRLLL